MVHPTCVGFICVSLGGFLCPRFRVVGLEFRVKLFGDNTSPINGKTQNRAKQWCSLNTTIW